MPSQFAVKKNVHKDGSLLERSPESRKQNHSDSVSLPNIASTLNGGKNDTVNLYIGNTKKSNSVIERLTNASNVYNTFVTNQKEQ